MHVRAILTVSIMVCVLTIMATCSYGMSIAAAKLLPDDTMVTLDNKVVTRSGNDSHAYYIQEADSSSGIKVWAPLNAVPGDIVTVTGRIRCVYTSGPSTRMERFIDPTSVTKTGHRSLPPPIPMRCRAVCGGPIPPYVPGVGDADGSFATGPHNTGLLVRVSGIVTEVGSTFFWLDDGSRVLDTWHWDDQTRTYSYRVGIMVRGVVKPPPVAVGQTVTVVGVACSVDRGWSSWEYPPPHPYCGRLLLEIPCATSISVSSVQAIPRNDGSHVVDFYYDLSFTGGATVSVGAKVSLNGGATYDITPASVAGDIGSSVTSGSRKRIAWRCGDDLPGMRGSNLRVAITASGGATTTACSSPFSVDNTAGPPAPVPARVALPYDLSGTKMMRCQLHTHVTGEVRDRVVAGDIEKISSSTLVDKYRAAGIDIVAQTEHAGVSETGPWGGLSGGSVGNPPWPGWIPHCAELTHGNWNPLPGKVILRDSHVLALDVSTSSIADLDIDTMYYGGTAINRTTVFPLWLAPFYAFAVPYPVTLCINSDVYTSTTERLRRIHGHNGLGLVAHVNSWPYYLYYEELQNMYVQADSVRRPNAIGVWSRGCLGIGKNDAVDTWDKLSLNTRKHVWGYVEDDYHPGSLQEDLLATTWLGIWLNPGDSWTQAREKIRTGNFFCYYMPKGHWPAGKTPPQIRLQAISNSDGSLSKLSIALSGLGDPPLEGIANFIDILGDKHWDSGVRTTRWSGWLANNGTFEYQCRGTERFLRVTVSLNYGFGELRISSQPILVDKVSGNPYNKASAQIDSARMTAISPELILTYVEEPNRPCAPSAGYVGDQYDVTTATGEVPPDATLQLSYDGSDVSAIGGTQYLAIYRYDDGTSDWVSIGGTVDPETATIESPITALGKYCVSADLPEDRTAPEVCIENPLYGAAVAADTAVEARVNDDLGAWRVSFYLNDHLLSTDTDAMDFWTADIPIADYCTGDWTLKAVAEDLAGNTGTTEIPIYISSSTPPPTVSIATPSAGSTVTGTVTATGTCGDNEAVSSVTLEMNDTPVGYATIDGSNWTCDIDTAYLADGNRTLTATVEDYPGNEASASINVTVNNGAANSSIGSLKTRSVGAKIRFAGGIVTAGTDLVGGGFYVEAPDRSSGIRVLTAQTVNKGDIVSVVGEVAAIGSEKAVQSYDVFVSSTGSELPKPIGVQGYRLLWPSPDSIGKYVKVWGKVISVDPSSPARWFVLDDGSGVTVKCTVPLGVTAPTSGLVAVTGVCSVDATSGGPAVIVSSQPEIQTLP
jgi:hypothetical protein